MSDGNGVVKKPIGKIRLRVSPIGEIEFHEYTEGEGEANLRLVTVMPIEEAMLHARAVTEAVSTADPRARQYARALKMQADAKALIEGLHAPAPSAPLAGEA